MGSRISKLLARRTHVTDENGSHQRRCQRESQPRLPYRRNDAFTLETSAAAYCSPTAAGQNPAGSTQVCNPAQTSANPRTSTASNLLEELPFAVADSIAMAEDETDVLPLSALEESPPAPQEPVVDDWPQINCLICCTRFGKDEEAIKPCDCDNAYCSSCLKNMFLAACKDVTRMPPRCCVIIPLHHARPYLSEKELALFKLKFEERNTTRPFYCPVAQCSAFIPNRLLPKTNSKKGKRRVDSGVGTPNPPTVSCPQCEVTICTECRDLAHLGLPCEPFKYGLDHKTAKLLKRWGYKRCPTCGEGVKRMFGCSHMACRCGAHFCWHCMRDPDNCAEDCYDDDNDDGYDEDEDGSEEDTHESAEEQGKDTEEEVAGPSSRNLDGGTAGYWQDSQYWFGDEPGSNGNVDIKMCYHSFGPHTVTLKDSLMDTSTTQTSGTECMRCWGTTHPEIDFYRLAKSDHLKVVPAGAHSVVGASRTRSHNQARSPAWNSNDTLKRELSGYTASVPDLNSPLVDQFSTPLVHENRIWFPTPSLESTSVVDTYGNFVATTEEPPRKRRRYSIGSPGHDDMVIQPTDPLQLDSAASSKSKRSLSQMKTSAPFRLAYRCTTCTLMVCETCKNELEREQDQEESQAEIEDDEDDLYGLGNMKEPVAAATATSSDELQQSRATEEPEVDEPSPTKVTAATYAEEGCNGMDGDYQT